MDVREILKSDAAKLLDAELEMLEEELATGDYDASYRKECDTLIEQERHARKVAQTKASTIAAGSNGQNQPKAHVPSEVSPTVLVSPDKLTPYGNIDMSKKTPKETVASDLAAIRRSDQRKSLFRKYLYEQSLIDEAFLDKHLSLFDDWELSAILDRFSLSEAFLEKYLSSLDARKVATTQLFSEEFFMKHYAAFDVQLVLSKSKNEWRKKDKRSRKLDTFLRLKGVHL